ncbi:MAG: leucine-rich repeat domain-containing protein, partial [Myxococcota bacterium]|nr:leucine-rich repeat domain-containing protein [Myxococcota bacterium]
HKQLTGVSVCFVGTTWERDLEEQRTLVTKRGGHLKDKPGKGVDVVVVGKGADRDQSAQSHPDALVVTEESFQRVLPKPRSGPKGRRAPTKRMGGDARSLFKLLSSRDVEQINQGLFLADSLKDGDVIDDLLSDVGVDEHGALSRGRRFSGTGPHQPYLDHALMGLLAVCVPGSKGAETRESLKSISLDGALAAPVMKGFSALERLSIVMGKGASISDLTGWGPLPSLRFLFIIGDRSYGGWAKERPLLSLKGLVAPELEELRISHNPITDVDPLSECRHLRKVDLSSCGSLESIAPLSNATELEWISLKYCSSLTSFEPLRGASRLAHCDLRGLTDVGSLSALAGKPGLRELGLTNCFFESTAPLADIDSWAPLSETGSGGHSTKLELRLTGWGDLTGLRGLDPTVETLEITVKGSGAGHAPLAGVPVRLSSVDGGLEILEVESIDAGDAS